jgi:cytochrome c peroxidase
MRFFPFLWILAACGGELDVSDHRSAGTAARGEELFERETFGGNGRVCATCHDEMSGSISTDEVRRRFLADPHDPLFRAIDSDGGLGLTYLRLLQAATIRVIMPLPPNVVLLDDPLARSVVLHRTPGTVFNIGLEPVIMWDGRAPNLRDQAAGAVAAHFEPARLPAGDERRDIEHYEETLFSSESLRSFFEGGPPPELPAGNTESERRGREFFVDQFDGTSSRGICAACHTGPMLNQITAQFPIANGIPCPDPSLGEDCPSTENPPVPPGSRFFTAFVSEFNTGANPVRSWLFIEPSGNNVVQSPDPGRALITGRFLDANFFKIPTLWGVSATSPYFHDGSVQTLEDLVAHYDRFFTVAFFGRITLSLQDQQDIVAFLKLL